jgi:hypothetical protein
LGWQHGFVLESDCVATFHEPFLELDFAQNLQKQLPGLATREQSGLAQE